MSLLSTVRETEAKLITNETEPDEYINYYRLLRQRQPDN